MGLSTSDIELLNLHHAEAGQWEWDTRNYVKDALFVSSIAIITKVLEGIPEVAIDEDAIKAAVEAAMADLPERTADELAERLRD